jgi:hypothetical protein
MHSLRGGGQKSLQSFRRSLLDGVAYDKSFKPKLVIETEQYREKMRADLLRLEEELAGLDPFRRIG